MTVSLSRLFRKICIKNNKKLTCHLFEMVASLKLFKIIKDNTMTSFTLQSILSEISQAEQPCASPCFVQARCFWEDFFKNHGNEPVAKLSQSLSQAQGEFCSHFPVYPFAKGVMVATAISYIYDQTNGNGFLKDPNERYYEEDCVLLAKKVIEAFSNSTCSVEIKMSAPEVAELFGLE